MLESSFSNEQPRDAVSFDLGRPLEEADRSKPNQEKGESDVYEFESEEGKLMIRKVIRESIGKKKEELEKMSAKLEAQFRLLKKYLGDRVVSTEYVILVLNDGSNALSVVQEKVIGTRFDKMRAQAGSELAKKFIDENVEVSLGVRDAQRDQETKDLFDKVPRAGGAFNNATLNVNQIWTPEGKLVIIDWT